MIQKMSFDELPLKGAYLIKPFFSDDLRGGFIKDYSKELFLACGINFELTETFYTISKKGVIRALHFQENNHQPKLVRCISGKVYDVIVDLRPNSPTFKKWMGFYLSGNNMNELLIPEHFAHGYLVIEDSIVSYKCAASFDAKNDSGVKFDDPDLDIDWPFNEIGGLDKMIISEKDIKLQTLKDYIKNGCK